MVNTHTGKLGSRQVILQFSTRVVKCLFCHSTCKGVPREHVLCCGQHG